MRRHLLDQNTQVGDGFGPSLQAHRGRRRLQPVARVRRIAPDGFCKGVGGDARRRRQKNLTVQGVRRGQRRIELQRLPHMAQGLCLARPVGVPDRPCKLEMRRVVARPQFDRLEKVHLGARGLPRLAQNARRSREQRCVVGMRRHDPLCSRDGLVGVSICQETARLPQRRRDPGAGAVDLLPPRVLDDQSAEPTGGCLGGLVEPAQAAVCAGQKLSRVPRVGSAPGGNGLEQRKRLVPRTALQEHACSAELRRSRVRIHLQRPGQRLFGAVEITQLQAPQAAPYVGRRIVRVQIDRSCHRRQRPGHVALTAASHTQVVPAAHVGIAPGHHGRIALCGQARHVVGVVDHAQVAPGLNAVRRAAHARHRLADRTGDLWVQRVEPGRCGNRRRCCGRGVALLRRGGRRRRAKGPPRRRAAHEDDPARDPEYCVPRHGRILGLTAELTGATSCGPTFSFAWRVWGVLPVSGAGPGMLSRSRCSRALRA